jgi:TNF receptor-associated protein 1
MEASELAPQQLEINPSHPLIVTLHNMRDKNSKIADLVAQQLFDNALVAAGLVDDPRQMLPRIQEILLHSMKNGEAK